MNINLKVFYECNCRSYEPKSAVALTRKAS
jgi:hypothetical protein